MILSAKQSDGLETWLHDNGYRIPKGASAALKPYMRQNMKFFVAKVNLKEQAKTGVAYLRPLQFAFESEKFMLPVRLGMLNARGPQDLVLYVLTPQGRVETTNYRTVKVPANMELPTYVRGEFAPVYKALFDTQATREDYRAIFTEYFWDMTWCDPCAADPLSPDELRQAGVFWQDGQPGARGGGQPVMLTRLHLRYTKASLPEDLVFQETADRQNFQARYVLRHPWKGDATSCSAAPAYLEEVDATAGARSRHARLADRVGCQRDPPEDGARAAAEEPVVGGAVEISGLGGWRRFPVSCRVPIAVPAPMRRPVRPSSGTGASSTRGSSKSRSWRCCSASACSCATSRSTRGRWRSRSRRALRRSGSGLRRSSWSRRARCPR